MNPYWVTFYSYKGGVGRTLALVNSAVILARSGRNVFLVDFDLEAPGMDSFSQLGLSLGHPGVVEYFSDFAKSSKAPVLKAFIQEPTSSISGSGKMWIMASGRKDREYNRMRDELNWTRLYDDGLGQLMIAEWKATIAKDYEPDYVFIDSRTGLTDIGGVCTLHLPDLVVTLFALNRQNTDGIRSVLAAITGAEVDRRPQIVTVATPVPAGAGDGGAVDEALKLASTALGRKIDRRISYNPAAALSEKIFVLDNADIRRQLVLEYEEVVASIQEKNVAGLDGLLERAERARETDDEHTALEVAATLEAQFGSRAAGVLGMAEIFRQFKGRERAVSYWEKAFSLDPTLSAAFDPLINFYKGKHEYSRVVELCERFLLARGDDKSEEVLEASVTKAEALMALSRPEDAVETYKTAFEADPDNLFDSFNYAEAIRRGTRECDQRLWERVIEMYEKHREDRGASAEANVAQAMHIAYACVGNIDRAKALLHKAKQHASSTPEVTTIFAVKTYQYVNKHRFLQDNQEFLEALDKGMLWDGMKIPTKDGA